MSRAQRSPPATLARELMRCSARLQQWARFMSGDAAGPLTGRQAQLIALLGPSSRTGALAANLGVTPAVVSNMMLILEKQGLVSRALRHGDHKMWVFELTERGVVARDQIADYQATMFSAALALLSADELQIVADALAVLERLVKSGE